MDLAHLDADLAERVLRARDRRRERALRPYRSCAKCGESKPAREFADDPKGPNGLRSWCRSCDNQRRRPRSVGPLTQ